MIYLAALLLSSSFVLVSPQAMITHLCTWNFIQRCLSDITDCEISLVLKSGASSPQHDKQRYFQKSKWSSASGL